MITIHFYINYFSLHSSRDKILKKVAGSFLHLLTACMDSASDMHIVVALGIVETTEM